LKSIAVIAIPVALQNLLTTTGSMVDTMMIAPLGEKTVAAVGLCAQFSSLLFSCYWGFVGGGMLFFSQFWGAKDKEGLKKAFSTTLLFMLSVAAVFTVVSFLRPSFILKVYTDKENIRIIGARYLRIVCIAYPFQIMSVVSSALLRSTEKVRIPLFASIVSVITNIVLNRVFIYGAFGISELGVSGAAVATVVAAVVNYLVILIASKIAKYPYVFSFSIKSIFDAGWMKKYLSKCSPIIINELLIGIGFMVINIVLGRQPEEAIAAIAVFRTLEGLIISFFAGFSNASSIIIGQNVGAGKLKEAYESAWRLIYLCGLVIAVACVTLFAVHKPVLAVMSLKGESLSIGTGMLGIYCIAAVIRMCNWTQTDTFRAGGDALFGTVLEIGFMYGMVLPCVCLSGIYLKWPTLVVFALAYVDEPIRFVCMQVHIYSGKWIKPVTKQGIKALENFRLEKINIFRRKL